MSAASVTRREAARRALLTAAAAAGGAALTGFGPRGRTARAAVVRSKVKLVAEVSWQGAASYAGPPKVLVQDFIDRYWTSQHPGVEVDTLGWGGDPAFLGASSAVGAILAGNGPDILMNCCDGVPQLMYSGVLQPIAPLLKRDNIDVTGVFPQGLLSDLTGPQGLMGLPDYGSTGPLFVNLSMFDELGLAYPKADWSYEDATRIWRSIAGQRQGQWVYGMDFRDNGSAFEWLVRSWGGSFYDASRTRCLLDSPESVAAHEWFVPLFVEKVATNSLGVVSGITSGQTPFTVGCCGGLQSAVLNFADKIKWDIQPVPAYPKGRGTYSGIGIYGMSALSKNPPELVWDLYKFITLSPAWQRYFNARLAFQPPSMSTPELWDDWMNIVRSVAPVLRDKHLEYYQQAMDWGYWRAYFRYGSIQAESILVKYQGLMQSGKISVIDGLGEITRQINALESTGAVAAAATSRELAGIRPLLAAAAQSPTPVVFPAPPRTGAGAPFASAGPLVASQAGVFTVTGAGSMAGGSSDDGTFAAAAVRESRATYTCRLAAVEALGGQVLHGGAKVGLMARGDLSDNAPLVFVDLDAAHGVHTDTRPLAGMGQAHQTNLGTTSKLVSASTKPVANWLLKPVWLRWVRSDTTWTGFWSTDGNTWTQAGAPLVGVEMAGCWLGLFVCSNNAPHVVRATFDQLQGFTPDTFVVLGG